MSPSQDRLFDLEEQVSRAHNETVMRMSHEIDRQARLIARLRADRDQLLWAVEHSDFKILTLRFERTWR